MRRRTIYPEFWQNESLARLSPHARLLFVALWQLADRAGLLPDRPAVIHGQVFPFERDLNVEALLCELSAGSDPFIIRGLACGKPVQNPVENLCITPETRPVIHVVHLVKWQHFHPNEQMSKLGIPKVNLGTPFTKTLSNSEKGSPSLDIGTPSGDIWPGSSGSSGSSLKSEKSTGAEIAPARSRRRNTNGDQARPSLLEALAFDTLRQHPNLAEDSDLRDEFRIAIATAGLTYNGADANRALDKAIAKRDRDYAEQRRSG